MDQNNNSGVNTILIVIILIVLVGGLVWFFSGKAPTQENPGINIDVTLPEGDSSAGEE
jgi:uncharacterized membrane protein YqiK